MINDHPILSLGHLIFRQKSSQKYYGTLDEQHIERYMIYYGTLDEQHTERYMISRRSFRSQLNYSGERSHLVRTCEKM